MQRWFYANDELICEKFKDIESDSDHESQKSIKPHIQRDWRFCVKIMDRELLPNEAIAVSGDCDELGNWEFENCILMTPINEDQLDKWHVYVKIPAENIVKYRYLIVAIDTESNQMIVRFFESHLNQREVPEKIETNIVDVCEDSFGWIDDKKKVERGWLTSELIVQFMFFKNQLKWCYPEMINYEYHIKVTPYFRKDLGVCTQIDDNDDDIPSQVRPFFEDIENITMKENRDVVNEEEEEKKIKEKKIEKPKDCGVKLMQSFTKLNLNSNENILPIYSQCPDDEKKINISTIQNRTEGQQDMKLSTAFAFNEVVNSHITKSTLQRQPTFGSKWGNKDLIIVHLTIGDFNNTVYLIELFKYSKNAHIDEEPYRVGYRYILPEDFKEHEAAYMEVPIICASKHRPIGSLTFHFLIVRPTPKLKYDLSVSYLRHWNTARTAMDGGHRGMGLSFNTSQNSIIHENTIYSLNQAIENGAHMVEFDVQLTKDHVPVIYHDFNVHVSKKDPTLLAQTENIDIPLNRYSYNALMNLKIPSQSEELSQIRIGDATEPKRLFPKLADVLNDIREDITFDIEIKWPQQTHDRKWEENVRPRTSRNFYVDRILEVVMSNAHLRRIVLTSFDADICTLLRFKQNLYPVMLILRNECEKPYLDPRAKNPTVGVNFAYNMELLGVVPHAKTFINNMNYVNESWSQNLVVFAYGIENHKDIDVLKKMGVSAVIFDRIDKFAEERRTSKINLGCGDEIDKEIEECSEDYLDPIELF